jgi:D-alanyl-D-alanine carboxypeptidase
MRNRPQRARVGRRELLRLAALGVAGGAVAWGCSRQDVPRQPDVAQKPDLTPAATPAPQPVATEPPAPSPVAIAGEPQCLVTKSRGLPSAYVPQDLTTLPVRVLAGNDVELRRPAADAAVQLIDSAGRDGHTLFILSGFRSYGEQERLLRDEIAQFGKVVAEKQVAPAGHSEHQLGLAADITSKRAPYELSSEFGRWPEGRWLAEQATRFGFVISYPEGKEDVTGYVYEPWHIRFVGPQIAEQVAKSGLTLTEFLPKYNLVGTCP